MDSNNAFDLLKEEMENEDVYMISPYQIIIKVNAIHRIPIVMALMTPDKIISELIQYLLSNKISKFIFTFKIIFQTF